MLRNSYVTVNEHKPLRLYVTIPALGYSSHTPRTGRQRSALGHTPQAVATHEMCPQPCHHTYHCMSSVHTQWMSTKLVTASAWSGPPYHSHRSRTQTPLGPTFPQPAYNPHAAASPEGARSRDRRRAYLHLHGCADSTEDLDLAIDRPVALGS